LDFTPAATAAVKIDDIEKLVAPGSKIKVDKPKGKKEGGVKRAYTKRAKKDDVVVEAGKDVVAGEAIEERTGAKEAGTRGEELKSAVEGSEAVEAKADLVDKVAVDGLGDVEMPDAEAAKEAPVESVAEAVIEAPVVAAEINPVVEAETTPIVETPLKPEPKKRAGKAKGETAAAKKKAKELAEKEDVEEGDESRKRTASEVEKSGRSKRQKKVD
jgi:hypothetical protein